MNKTGNIYEWLKEVQKRPAMYISEGNNLTDLERLMVGYFIALQQHGIVEEGPKFSRADFTQWLHVKTGIGGALGWANIINEKYAEPSTAFEKFWEYIAEYKNLRG